MLNQSYSNYLYNLVHNLGQIDEQLKRDLTQLQLYRSPLKI